MTLTDDDIVLAILIQIDDDHRDAPLDVPIGMEFPFAFPGLFGLLVPTVADEYIVASIAIEIADPHAVLVAGFTDDFLFE